MSDDFQVGDVVIRARDATGKMPIGSVRRVTGLFWWEMDDEPGLALEFEGDQDGVSWYACSFRKLPKADNQFTEQMWALAPARVST